MKCFITKLALLLLLAIITISNIIIYSKKNTVITKDISWKESYLTMLSFCVPCGMQIFDFCMWFISVQSVAIYSCLAGHASNYSYLPKRLISKEKNPRQDDVTKSPYKRTSAVAGRLFLLTSCTWIWDQVSGKPMMVFHVVLLLVLALLFFWKLAKTMLKPRLNCPKSLPSLPIIGSLLQLAGHSQLHLLFYRLQQKYGSIFSLYMGPHYVVVVNNYLQAKEVLLKKGKIFAGRPQTVSNSWVHGTILLQDEI